MLITSLLYGCTVHRNKRLAKFLFEIELDIFEDLKIASIPKKEKV